MAQTTHDGFITLSSRGLRHDILPMRLYHKAKKLGIWDPRSIDFTQDRRDWQQLPEDVKERLRGLIAGFQAGEESVTLDLLPLIMVIAQEGRLEEEMFLTTFLWEEAKHVEFFRRFLDEVMQEKGDLHHYHGPGYKKLFYEELPKVMYALLSDPSPKAQVEASVTYNMIIEGVLAESGYYSFYNLLSYGHIMPGLKEGIGYLKRDESRHIAYGVFLISRLVAADKSLWSVVEERMNRLFTQYMEGNQQGAQAVPPAAAALNREYSKMQFEKRLARIKRAQEQTVEQVYQSSASESEAEGAEAVVE